MFERRLINYLPPILRDVREYKAIMNDAEQSEVEELWKAADDVLNNQFITDATEKGVLRWERVLGIVPQATLSLNERKFTILARLNEQLPFTLKNLENLLRILCGEDGFTVQINPSGYTLIVKIALTAKKNYSDVEQMLKRIVPANLLIQLSLMYNTYEQLNLFNHQNLKVHTHYQLRNEVLTNGNENN